MLLARVEIDCRSANCVCGRIVCFLSPWERRAISPPIVIASAFLPLGIAGAAFACRRTRCSVHIGGAIIFSLVSGLCHSPPSVMQRVGVNKSNVKGYSRGSEAEEGERPDGDDGEARGNEGTVLWQG